MRCLHSEPPAHGEGDLRADSGNCIHVGQGYICQLPAAGKTPGVSTAHTAPATSLEVTVAAAAQAISSDHTSELGMSQE